MAPVYIADTGAVNLHLLVEAVVKGDAPLAALLAGQKLYSGGAAKTADGVEPAKPFLNLGSTDEYGQWAFARPGWRTSVTGDIWTARAAQREMLTISGHLSRLFDRKVFALGTLMDLYTTYELISTMRDPEEGSGHGVFRITGLARKRV